jgi:hypothetical protein
MRIRPFAAAIAALVILLSGVPVPTVLAGGDPVLVGAGDIASCSKSGDTKTARLVQAIPGTVFTAGDNAYTRGTLAQFQSCYDPTWGAFKSRTRPSPGNHEYRTAGASGYFSYFGPLAGTAGEGWYAYDLGEWRIYALNSNCSAVGGCGAASPQTKWLKADLAANPRRCVLAYWHHPRFNSGKHGPFNAARPFWKLFVKHHVELVLNGHEHFYERFEPVDEAGERSSEGVVQLTVGTGGVGFSEFLEVHPSSAARQNDTYGVVKLKLDAKGWSSEFLAVPGATFTDRASGSCRW